MFDPRSGRGASVSHGSAPSTEPSPHNFSKSFVSVVQVSAVHDLRLPNLREEYIEKTSLRVDPEALAPRGDGGSRYFRQMAALNSKIAVGELCSLAAYGAAVAGGLPYAIDAMSPALLVVGSACLGAYHFIQSGLNALAAHCVSRAPTAIKHLDVAERVSQIAQKLCADSGQVVPRVHVVDSKEPYAGLLDRLFAKDILIIGAEMARFMNDRELQGVVAHELCHANRTYTKLGTMKKILHGIASPAIICVSGIASFGLMSDVVGTYIAGVGAAVVAGCVWVSTMSGLRRLSHFISRHNELKTDLRAVRLTNDPEGYITALSRVSLVLPPAQIRKGNSGRHSHPTIESRLDLIKHTFQSPKKVSE